MSLQPRGSIRRSSCVYSLPVTRLVFRGGGLQSVPSDWCGGGGRARRVQAEPMRPCASPRRAVESANRGLLMVCPHSPSQASRSRPRPGESAPRRILIATVTAGAGHLQAAAALEEAWRRERPADTVERWDVLAWTPRLYRKAYADGYVALAEGAPELYSLLFRKTDNPSLHRRLTRLRRAVAEWTTPKFTRRLLRFGPEAVLCTHFMPLDILGQLRSKPTRERQPLVASIVTDFEAHALWMEPAVDLYCVAAEETRARLVARGVPPARVAVTGIPISERFSAPVDAAAVRRQTGLRDDLPVLLVLGGGFGMGPVAEILGELQKLTRPVQIVVICGRNEDLRKEVAVLERRHPTHVFGFVTHMHELMAAADLVISKPGGLTSAEALALGKPLFILNPVPGQETANSDFLLAHGAAAKANRVEDLPFRLARLLGSPELAAMGRAARALGRPDAALRICRRVLESLSAGAAAEGRASGEPLEKAVRGGARGLTQLGE